MALAPVLKIPDHLLKLLNLRSQLHRKSFIALIAGYYRTKGLFQGIYHIKQLLVGGLELVVRCLKLVNPVLVILALTFGLHHLRLGSIQVYLMLLSLLMIYHIRQ